MGAILLVLLLSCCLRSISVAVDGFALMTTANTRRWQSPQHLQNRNAYFHYYPSSTSSHQQLSSSPSKNQETDNDVIDGQGAVSVTTPDDYTLVVDPKSKAEIRNIITHLSKQTLESLLSPSDAKMIYDELFFSSSSSSSSIFNEDTYQQYVKYWDKLLRKLREETRTPADLLGTDITNRILSFIRGERNSNNNNNNSSYDAQTVKAFLESDAINSLFTQLLYDAIFEFTTKFDILGNAISNLPLLGPVRNQVLKESKRNMDRTLGPLLRQFLSGYTRVAVRQTIDFVVSKENAVAFGNANAKLVGYLMEKRSLSDWIPEEKILVEWRQDVWDYLVGLETNNGDGNDDDDNNKKKKKSDSMVKIDQQQIVNQSIDWIYDLIGDKCIDDAGVNVDAILDASPTLEKNVVLFWKRCKDSASISK